MIVRATSLVRTSLRTSRMLRGETSRVFAGRWQHTLKDQYEYVQVEKTQGGVGLIRLHRPKALNALCDDLFKDLVHVSFGEKGNFRAQIDLHLYSITMTNVFHAKLKPGRASAGRRQGYWVPRVDWQYQSLCSWS
jgi:hypothetical protein